MDSNNIDGEKGKWLRGSGFFWSCSKRFPFTSNTSKTSITTHLSAAQVNITHHLIYANKPRLIMTISHCWAATVLSQ